MAGDILICKVFKHKGFRILGYCDVLSENGVKESHLARLSESKDRHLLETSTLTSLGRYSFTFKTVLILQTSENDKFAHVAGFNWCLHPYLNTHFVFLSSHDLHTG
jgi:hypothetical protein